MKIELLSTFVNIKSNDDLIDKIILAIKKQEKTSFFCLNTFSLLLNRNKTFLKAFNSANYVLPDGWSIPFYIKHIQNVIVDKVAFNHLFINELYKDFSARKLKCFCLGATESIVCNSAQILSTKYGLEIVGYNNGYFDKQNETEQIISKINNSKAECLIVCMGMPISEIWISQNISKLNPTLFFSVGGFFDIISEKNKIAPKWMYNSGLEWLYRLKQEPRRLLFRYFKANLYFAYIFIIKRVAKLFSNKL